MKIVYMGTPDFAVGPLEAIIEAGHEVVLVITQPDKPKGRGKEMQATPVKECALKHDIAVYQPEKIRSEDSVAYLKNVSADMYVVAAFGQILSEEVLNIPKYGCVNIHASLLPKYRGAGPIQRVILDGEKVTGVTIMQMDKGLDTGDILLAQEVEIDSKETGDSLHDKLAAVGSKLIVEAMDKIEKGLITPIKQDDSKSCYAKMLSKSMGLIDWNKASGEIDRLIRGLNSWPSAYTYYNGKMLKLWDADICDEVGTDLPDGFEQNGMVVKVSKDAVYVKAGEGYLRINELQPEGKKRMKTRDYLLGYHINPGDILG